MKLAQLVTPLAQEMQAILDFYKMPASQLEEGKTGLKGMYALLDIVSKNRAYDDAHPDFTSGQWKRVLPHDGRDYCFYYVDGANDSHVATGRR